MVMTDEELLREMRQAKDPVAHVQVLAELNAVATDTMREYLRDLGVDLPAKRRRPRRFDEARARELLEAGKTDAEVAAALGVARRSIYDFRESQGIPMVRQRRGRMPRPPGPAPAVPASGDPGTTPTLDAPPETPPELCGGADVVQAWAVVADGRPVLYLRRREIAEAVQALIALDKNLREE